MIYKKLKIIVLFLIIIFSANIFGCTISITDQSLSTFLSSQIIGDNVEVILNVSLIDNSELKLQPQNCENKKIVFVIDSHKTINISGSRDNYIVSGMDVIEFRNNANLTINVDNLDNVVRLTTIDIDADIYSSMQNRSVFSVLEAERSWSSDSSYWPAHGIKMNINNLIIDQNSDFNLSIISKNPNNPSDNYDATYSGVSGGPALFDCNQITNYGNLRLDLIAGDGGKGSDGKKKKNRDGGNGGIGGDANLQINFIDLREDALFLLNLKSGNGGNGGKGSREGGGWFCPGEPRPGGTGAAAGSIDFNISKIYSKTETALNISLLTGNGGNGGSAGANNCSSDSSGDASLGGNGGNISDINILDLRLDGNLFFFINAGNGGNAGLKVSDGSYNYGGDGGSVGNLNISNFTNNHKNVLINILSGKKGIYSSSYPCYFGKPGVVGDININYLENNNRGIEIISRVNQTIKDTADYLSCTSNSPETQFSPGEIKINYLASGSYLPKKLKTISAYQIDNTKIEINACYIKSSGLKRLEYQTGQLTINSANTDHFLNDFDYDKSRILVFNRPAITCPICDALELTNLNRVDDTYTIYSNNSGTINAGDLKIYYLKEDGQIFKPHHLLPNEEYVVYTNNSPIIGTISQRFTDPAVYEYVLSKDKLFSPRYNVLLSEVTDSKAYCSGQQYKIKGTITLDNGSSKTFDFPFIPIYGFE